MGDRQSDPSKLAPVAAGLEAEAVKRPQTGWVGAVRTWDGSTAILETPRRMARQCQR